MSQDFLFDGFSSPNYTIVPDELFDELLAILSGAEIKVLLYIIRRTFGFKKNSDDISLRQMVEGIRTKDGRVLDHGAGVTLPTAIKATRRLVEIGAILAKRNRSVAKGDEATTYTLRFRGQTQADADRVNIRLTPVSSNLRGGAKKILDGGLKKFKTQETVLQETVEQETEHSKRKELARNTKSNNKGGLRGENSQTLPKPTSTKNPANISLFPAELTSVSADDASREQELKLQGAASTRSGMTSISEALAHRSAAQYLGSQSPQKARRTVSTASAASEDLISPNPTSGASLAPRKRRSSKARTPYLDAVIADLSAQDLRDSEHTPSNIVQARNILALTVFDESTFVQNYVYPARSETRAQSGVTNKAAYFFAVLRDKLALNEDQLGPRPPMKRDRPDSKSSADGQAPKLSG